MLEKNIFGTHCKSFYVAELIIKDLRIISIWRANLPPFWELTYVGTLNFLFALGIEQFIIIIFFYFKNTKIWSYGTEN